MHTATVVAYKRFRHKCRRFTVSMRNISHDIFQSQHFVGFFDQSTELNTDLALACCCDLMVMHLGNHAHFFENQTHRGTHILQRIDRGNREITAFHAWTMPHVSVFIGFFRVPTGLGRIDLV